MGACRCSLKLCQGQLAQVLTTWATRRTLAVPIVFEILVCLYVLILMLVRQRITLLGLHRGYLRYLVIVTVRAICSIVMLFGVLFRKVRTTRWMITFFMINSIVSIYTIVPFFRAKCNCASYFQCEVLHNFAAGEHRGDFMNPRNIEEPGWIEDEDCKPNGICTTHFGTNVHVKYTEQPPMRTTSSFMQESFIARRVEPRGDDPEPKSAGLLSTNRLRHHRIKDAGMHDQKKNTVGGCCCWCVSQT